MHRYKLVGAVGVIVMFLPSVARAEVLRVGSDVRTITEAIARQPRAGTVIQLSSGVYSAESGETLPIRLPRGVSLRGDPSNQGANVVIRGGGRFVSPTFADQNAAIIPSQDSVIEGITITNPNPRGYGVWIESRQGVIVRQSTFVGNTHDGVMLTGTAEAVISDNRFLNNGSSGLSAVGSSGGEIRQNLFENTGFGLSIGQKSQVRLIGNRIINNLDGIVVTHTATPVLRHNLIEGSTRDGLVVVADRDRYPRPDLGTTGDQGNNTFRQNRQYDLHNLSPVAIVSVGNQLNASRVKGKLAFDTPQVAPAPRFPSTLSTAPRPLPNINPSASTGGLRFPDSWRTDTTPSQRQKDVRVAQAPRRTIIIEREVRPALDSRTGQPLRFRVIVPIANENDLARIRTVIPDAFRTQRGGRSVAQVGAYSDRVDAENQAQRVVPLGYRPEIINF